MEPDTELRRDKRRKRSPLVMTAFAAASAACTSMRTAAAFHVGGQAHTSSAKRFLTTASWRIRNHRGMPHAQPGERSFLLRPPEPFVPLRVSTDDQSTSESDSSAQSDNEEQKSPPSSATPAAPKFANDTTLINNAGSALNTAGLNTAVASTSILAVDPATIEIVPVSVASAGLTHGLVAPELEQADADSVSVEVDGRQQSQQQAVTEMPEPEQPAFVKMFRGSANYIANHRGTTAVYHLPGDLLEWDGFADLIDDIALTWLLGMNIVIVIGCRHQIDARLDQHHIDPIRHSSIRVTDKETLRVVKEEAGFVRFEVERQLARSLRIHHQGYDDDFSGNVVSGNFYSAQPFGVIDGVDYMYTGFPRRVEVDKIRQVHQADDIVLLTTLGASPSGEIFNVNSESLAASVAGSLAASKIIYFSIRGTALRNTDTNKIIQNLRVTDARNLLQHYRVKIHAKGFASVEDSGMDETNTTIAGGGANGDVGGTSSPIARARYSPSIIEALLKIGWAMSALDRGVKRAHILAPTNGALLQELYTRDGAGTLISRDLYEGIRPGDVNDVAGIYDLIDPLVKAGTLVPRPRNIMEKDIRSYYVYTRDNLIVACGQLKRFEGGYAEIGCLVVSRDYRSQGRGDAMLGYLERLCLQCGATKVFVLSTQTMEWFVERGFTEVDVSHLPPSRRAVYNHERRSKIYMKHIDGDRDLDAQELWWNR